MKRVLSILSRLYNKCILLKIRNKTYLKPITITPGIQHIHTSLFFFFLSL